MAKIKNEFESQSERLLVQKSLPLFSLWQSELTLAEFKILDTYLSRIDSHRPENRVVTFEKGELEEKLGVSKINQSVLETRLKHLMGNVVKIPDNDEKRGFRLVTLFEEAIAEQDDYGLWRVRLGCTQMAMKYFFNIENLGYLKYRLHCVVSLKSRYSYIMFIYLEHNRYRKSWEVPLDYLKEILHSEEEDTYKEYKYFNNLVLKKCHKELTEKTDLRYSYESVKKGRTVVAIRFNIENANDLLQYEKLTKNLIPSNANSDKEQVVESPKLFEIEEQPPQEFKYQNDALEFLAGACENEFNNEQMMIIFNIIALSDKIESTGMGLEFDRYHFLAKKYSEMNYYGSKIKINNRFSYFKRAIENSLAD